MACPQVPCPHCDQPCTSRHCSTCQTIHSGMAGATQRMTMMPDPGADLRDAHVGEVGTCATCGGRTYMTLTGPWCTRAGCTGGGGVETSAGQAP